MALVTPDFSEAIKPVEAGDYPVRVSGFKNGKSQKSGDPYINWSLEIVGGEQAGRKFSYFTMLAGKGSGNLLRFLELCIEGYAGGPFDPEAIVGSRMVATIAPEEYNGQTSMKVKEVSAAESFEDSHDRF